MKLFKLKLKKAKKQNEDDQIRGIKPDSSLEKSGEEKPVKAKRKPNKKALLLISLFLSLLFAFLGVFLVRPALQLKAKINPLQEKAKLISSSLQSQDLKGAVEGITALNQELSQTRQIYKKMAWLKVVPFANNYYKDGERLFNGAGYLLEAVDLGIKELEPYSDILGLVKEGEDEQKPKEVMTVEERLLLVLDTIDKIQPGLDSIGEKVKLAQDEIDKIDPNRYPEEIKGKKIRSNIISIKSAIDGAAEILLDARPILGHLKSLLGMPDEKHYLLLFQNDAELRPTGGFITAYAILSVKDGKVTPLGSYDIYTADASFGNRLPAPDAIKDYHKNVFYWHLRDMNLSPDFVDSMEVFWENFSKTQTNKNIDGIIALDTNVLVDLLKILGQIGVPGWGNFSAETDSRCDCPNVVYQLEAIADRPTNDFISNRKAVLGPLMHSMLANIMGSPRKTWPEYFNAILANIQEKHLLFYFFNEDLQNAIEALNAAGRIKDFEDDYFHLNDCNFAGAKSNLFIKQNVVQNINVDSDGTITKEVTITYKNPAPASNCNLEAGELCLNGLYRDWVRLYVPKGSELLESTGAEIEAKTYEDLGKTVFEVFYGDQSPLRPEGKKELTFKYKLPFKLGDDGYKLMIQKQPGTYSPEYEINFKGKTETFDLTTDKILNLGK